MIATHQPEQIAGGIVAGVHYVSRQLRLSNIDAAATLLTNVPHPGVEYQSPVVRRPGSRAVMTGAAQSIVVDAEP